MRTRRRFTPEFKARVVLDVLTGQQSPAEACRRHALGPNRLSLRKATSLRRAHAAFQADDHDDVHNTKRTRSPLGYLTPAEFEQQWVNMQRTEPTTLS